MNVFMIHSHVRPVRSIKIIDHCWLPLAFQMLLSVSHNDRAMAPGQLWFPAGSAALFAPTIRCGYFAASSFSWKLSASRENFTGLRLSKANFHVESKNSNCRCPLGEHSGRKPGGWTRTCSSSWFGFPESSPTCKGRPRNCQWRFARQ